MPFWDRGSVVVALLHCGAPKVGAHITCVVCIVAGHDRACRGLSMARHMNPCKVLLMLWNSQLPWDKPPFQFTELFAGRGNVSREWLGPRNYTCISCALRKRCGFNVARFDYIYGQRGSKKCMDFCSSSGFVSGPHARTFVFISEILAQASPFLVPSLGSWGDVPHGAGLLFLGGSEHGHNKAFHGEQRSWIPWETQCVQWKPASFAVP